MLQTIWTAALPGVALLVATLISSGLAYGVAWLRHHTKNTIVLGIAERAASDISALVAAQAQVLDNKRGDDGKLDPAEAAAAKEEVIKNLKELWGPDGIARLSKILGLTDSTLGLWLSAKVEEAVRNN